MPSDKRTQLFHSYWYHIEPLLQQIEAAATGDEGHRDQLTRRLLEESEVWVAQGGTGADDRRTRESVAESVWGSIERMLKRQAS